MHGGIKAFAGFVLTCAAITSFAQSSSDCSVSCRGDGTVQVDLGARCMCIDKDNCFKINIGTEGPKETTQGAGILGEAKGCAYQTKGSCSLNWDNDAIAMGIPENDETGKWIHKTRNCAEGGNDATAGCIAVPCEHWKEVKDQMGKKLDVCGGGAPLSRNSRGRGGGGSSTGSGNDGSR